MTDQNRLRLIKPNENTPFHIDFAWWKEMDQNWHVDLRGMLCQEHKEMFTSISEDQLIDWIDPDTAEIKQMDGLQHIITTHCAKNADYSTTHTTLVDAVFRTFLANGNIPLSSKELGQNLARSTEMILRTLAGPRVYKGIRPFTLKQ